MPPLTDLLALLGIDLALCAGCLRLLSGRRGIGQWAQWTTAICFVLLWLPVGVAHLPVLAYVRGMSSDLSVTLVALTCLGLCQRLLGFAAVARREKMALNCVVAGTAAFLYPLALGWGDLDVYRAGWGSYGMWAALLALSLLCWTKGLRLLPMMVGLSMLAWCLDIMESSNLWDYLMDPWLAAAAFIQCTKAGAAGLLARFRRPAPVAGHVSP